MLRCADKPLWRRIAVDVREARAHDDMNAVGIVGIDETSQHPGQSYINVVHALVTAPSACRSRRR